MDQVKAIFCRKASLQALKSPDRNSVIAILEEVSTAMTEESDVVENDLTFVEACLTLNPKSF